MEFQYNSAWLKNSASSWVNWSLLEGNLMYAKNWVTSKPHIQNKWSSLSTLQWSATTPSISIYHSFYSSDIHYLISLAANLHEFLCLPLQNKYSEVIFSASFSIPNRTYPFSDSNSTANVLGKLVRLSYYRCFSKIPSGKGLSYKK